MKRMMSIIKNLNNRKENRGRKRPPVLFALWMMAVLLIIYGLMSFAAASGQDVPGLATPTDLSAVQEEEPEEERYVTPPGSASYTDTEDRTYVTFENGQWVTKTIEDVTVEHTFENDEILREGLEPCPNCNPPTIDS